MDESKINSGVRVSRLSGSFFKGGGDNADKNWLNNFAQSVLETVKEGARDIGNYFKSVAGGAKVVIEKVFAGDWGFFKTWFNEAPLIPKLAGTGAALLTGAVVFFASGAALGGIGAGIKGVIAKIGLTNGLLLSGMMPGIMTNVINVVEWAWEFNWAIPDKSIIAQCKEALNRIYEPLGDSLGTAFAAIVVGRWGKAFASPATDIDLSVAACYCIVNPTLEETIIDAMADLLVAIKSIAYEILFLQTYKGIRAIAGKLTGNEWGKDGSQPFVISQKVETAYEELKASDYLGHITEEQWEGIESFGDSFMDTFKDLLQEEDTYVNWVKR